MRSLRAVAFAAVALTLGHAVHADPPAQRQPAGTPGSQIAAVIQGGPTLELSPQALRVSQIAAINGDRRYIMVDKAHGKLFLFENGRPVYSRDALTGASLADQFPPDAFRKPVHEQYGVRYKVTPAGRFTLKRAHDAGLGDTLDINEIRGVDWALAIHQVWLGNRAERRDARLRSDNGMDKHITSGCVDVDVSTMRQLLHLLANGNGTPIYILPLDDSLTQRYFRPRVATFVTRAPRS